MFKNRANLIVIVIVTIFVALLYVCLIKLFKLDALYFESNYQNNRSKIQNLFSNKNKSKVLLCGSSITRTILSKYFNVYESTINLGLDGLSPFSSLQIIKKSNIFPKVIVLEANLIGKLPSKNDKQIFSILNNKSFHVTKYLFKSDYRPSSILYTKLKKSLMNSSKINNKLYYPDIKQKNIDIKPTINPNFLRRYGKYINKLIAEINYFESKGTKFLILIYPTEKMQFNKNNISYFTLYHLLKQKKIPVFDLSSKKIITNNNLKFTDGIHLNSNSAKKIAKIIQKIIDEKIPHL